MTGLPSLRPSSLLDPTVRHGAPTCLAPGAQTSLPALLAIALLLPLPALGCLGGRPQAEPASSAAAPPDTAPAGPAARPLDLDSLAAVLGARADTAALGRLPALESEIRDWLARLEFEDPSLLPLDPPPRFFRDRRGRLLDALGWAAFRRGDLRQAEAALVSAAAEINSRGTTSGYARHFLHMGRVYAARGRSDLAIEAYVDAEARGLGAAATPLLEQEYRRRHGSLAGLDRLRQRERARIEDERRQLLVAGALSERLPSFAWPRRTGPPLASGPLIGEPLVLAIWDDACAGCAGFAERLAPLGAALRARAGTLVAVWLGDDPAAAGPPQSYAVLAPPDPAAARAELAPRLALPTLLVVDSGGWIRYRWAGAEALAPPTGDILVQVDHLRRRAR